MENKKVGWIIIGISIVMSLIVLIFNLGLKKIVGDTCTHGPECSMFETIAIQTWISIAIVMIILIIGLFIMLSKPEEKTIIKKIKEKSKLKKIDLSNLEKDEKKVIEFLQKEQGGVFQRELMEKLEIGKVKTTRLLDKLESKDLIIRKRRGMNNIILLKKE
ncbi:MAG: hypothetical protein WC812_01630 [Candidatus Pacearchaeota archaeon]|jgi:uncharacterized membrane protein